MTHPEKTPPFSHQHHRQISLIRFLAVGSVLGLIVLGVAWELALAPIKPGGSLLALKVVPLWLYFTEGVVRAYSDRPPSNYLAMVEVLLCLILFAACTLHVKLRFKHAQTTTEEEGLASESPAG